MSTRVVLAVPSYRGISAEEALALVGGEELRRANIDIRPLIVRKVALLDYARNELLAMAHASGAAYTLWQDDDTRTDSSSIREMIALAETSEVDVLSAPVEMKRDTLPRQPNVGLSGGPVATAAGSLVAQIAWTGLASVLVSRRATAALVESCRERHYRPHPTSIAILQRLGAPPRAWNVFGSLTVPATALMPEERGDAKDDEQVFLGDDKVFSYRAREVGLTMRAFLQAVTDHAGMGRYCMAEELVKR